MKKENIRSEEKYIDFNNKKTVSQFEQIFSSPEIGELIFKNLTTNEKLTFKQTCKFSNHRFLLFSPIFNDVIQAKKKSAELQKAIMSKGFGTASSVNLSTQLIQGDIELCTAGRYIILGLIILLGAVTFALHAGVWNTTLTCDQEYEQFLQNGVQFRSRYDRYSDALPFDKNDFCGEGGLRETRETIVANFPSFFACFILFAAFVFNKCGSSIQKRENLLTLFNEYSATERNIEELNKEIREGKLKSTHF